MTAPSLQTRNYRPADQVLQTKHKRKYVKKVRGPASTFVSFHLSHDRIKTLLGEVSDTVAASIHWSDLTIDGRDIIMETRKAWHKNLANPANIRKDVAREITDDISVLDIKETNVQKQRRKNHKKPTNQRLSLTPSASILKPEARPSPRTPNTNSSLLNHTSDDYETTSSSSSSSSSEAELDTDENGYLKNNEMSSGARPALKLKLSTLGGVNTNNPTAQSPAPPSAVRTPSIKLNFGTKSGSPATPSLKIKAPKADANGVGTSSQKKRKRQPGEDDEEPAPKQVQRKLTLKTVQTPVTPAPVFKLKTKGKPPKRPPGVGYDSELEEREQDPVMLDGFVLRMPPGPDCDYIQKAIKDGTIGVHRAQGGADVRMRFLDTNGRRGIIIINGNQYATSVVDLPCIVEGMKSWDKKGWIKSIDITQMMLVLGRCQNDDEAKNYPLPPDVNPKTFAYEHGLTAPMHWVRKRRFARTRRARVDDIESIERKVHQLLEADAKAEKVTFQVLNYNPETEDQYSADDYDDEEDAEGDFDDGYFPPQNGIANGMADTPMYNETPGPMEDEEIPDHELNDFEAMFMEEDDNPAPAMNGTTTTKIAINGGLQPLDQVRDSSIAVTSASGSPAPGTSAAPTPAADAQPTDQSDEEESDADDDSEKDDAEKDADENLRQIKDQITDMESKIREQTEHLKRTQNAILRKKLALKIRVLQDDVALMKKNHGLDDGDEGDGDD